MPPVRWAVGFSAISFVSAHIIRPTGTAYHHLAYWLRFRPLPFARARLHHALAHLHDRPPVCDVSCLCEKPFILTAHSLAPNIPAFKKGTCCLCCTHNQRDADQAPIKQTFTRLGCPGVTKVHSRSSLTAMLPGWAHRIEAPLAGYAPDCRPQCMGVGATGWPKSKDGRCFGGGQVGTDWLGSSVVPVWGKGGS
ncbi:hypothetical protein BC828DRAFT_378157 [Blastocladiella britannica]|nr:hypothetical protein BC828DRAFT_378157 [Blastocladiella britannica]